MSKYYQKQLREFNIGDSVVLNGEMVYVTDIRKNQDIITLILSGICNHTGNKESTIMTYGTPKRVRRTKEQIEESKIAKQELLLEKEREKQYLNDINVLYHEFLKSKNIKNDIKYFKRVKIESIVIGDFIKRGKSKKIEMVIDIQDCGKYFHVKGYMGFEDNTDPMFEKDFNSIPKEYTVYKYINGDEM